MPLLPLKALRRGNRSDDEEEGGRRRVTRGVTLMPASPGDDLQRSRLAGFEVMTPVGKNIKSAGLGEVQVAPRNLSTPASAVAVTPKVVVRPVPSRVTFAPSPINTSLDITPYAKVYGVHPAFFDFDQNGAMQPTAQGVCEMMRGALSMTPTAKGLKALVVSGTPGAMSPCSSDMTPTTSSPTGVWMTPKRPQADNMGFSLGEQVLVITDDGRAWMDASVIALFPTDTESEGYSIPAGTVKVSYELGIKWVMPQNIPTTLRKKPPQVAPYGGYMQPKLSVPRPTYTGGYMPQAPGSPQQSQQMASPWPKYPGQPNYLGRAP